VEKSTEPMLDHGVEREEALRRLKTLSNK
jgi:hypothetical protein